MLDVQCFVLKFELTLHSLASTNRPVITFMGVKCNFTRCSVVASWRIKRPLKECASTFHSNPRFLIQLVGFIPKTKPILSVRVVEKIHVCQLFTF